MRRLFIGMVVAVTTVLLPVLALADNQEIAENIASNLRESGQLQGYKIGVKFQNGTAWIRGQVTSPEQLAAALQIVKNTDGVSQVVDKLEIAKPAVKLSTATLRTPESTLAPEPVIRQTSATQTGSSISRTAERLQAVVDELLPARNDAPAPQATRLPNSYTPQPVRRVAAQPIARQPAMMRSNRPVPVAYINGQPAAMPQQQATPMPAYSAPMASGAAPVRYDQPCMPRCAWPSYAAYPNYAAVTYPKQYSPTAWPYIGPFYPYPQVPLGWRKVTLEWDDGWWMLDFKDSCCH